MKAIVMQRTGGPEVLEYAEVPTPKPGKGEVLVKAHAIGVSRPEIMVRLGTYKWMPKLPVIPGIEMSGTIVERGDGVANLAPGTPVFISARELAERAGCYAEYIAVPAAAVQLLAADIDLDRAACLASYQVAYHVLHSATRGVIGDVVVVNGANGGIGSAAVQLAKAAGKTVVAVVSSQDKVATIAPLGADHVVVDDADLEQSIETAVGRNKVDLVLDILEGPSLHKYLRLLGPWGMLVSYGHLAGPAGRDVLRSMLGKPAIDNSVAVRAFSMHTLDDAPAERHRATQALADMLASGAIRPIIARQFPLREAGAAHTLIESRGLPLGKVLLKP